ncbi:MAG: aminotransferase class V-fold PLP-dependent enzyme [Halanaerobiales bacterium]|nr:aminotransferase class V-fold PLP-dependent enzyme [Halanaerobiales bacterium]
MIYFDNSATTFPKPDCVYKKMHEFYSKKGVNPGRGSYRLSREAEELTTNTRNLLKNILDVNSMSKDVVFTPSATFAINMILKGISYPDGANIYYTPFEHNASLRPLHYLKDNQNVNLIKIPIDQKTYLPDFNKLKNLFETNSPHMLVASHISNVCGVIQPVENLAGLAKDYNSYVLIDGAQSAGLINIKQRNIDFYVWAGHKSLYGPFGIAGVVAEKNSLQNIEPLLYGGTGINSSLETMPDELPYRYEAGSNNILSIAGLNAALKWIKKTTVQKIFQHDKKITTELIEILQTFMDIKLFLPDNLNNHINIVSIKVNGYSPDEFGKLLDEKFDIAVRTGLHCAPEAHGFLGTFSKGLIRFSLGYYNTHLNLHDLKKNITSFLI